MCYSRKFVFGVKIKEPCPSSVAWYIVYTKESKNNFNTVFTQCFLAFPVNVRPWPFFVSGVLPGVVVE